LNGLISVLGDLPVLFMQLYTIDEVLYQWEAIGIFDFVLPFLLVFAVVFGILTSTNILGGHKGVNIIISLVIGLMALRLGFVQAFFTELFPRFGIGLAILVVLVIFAGLFIGPESRKGWFIGFSIAGVVIGLAVVISTFDTFAWFNSFFWQQNWGLIIGGILIIIVIVALFVTAGKPPASRDWGVLEPLRRSIHE